MAAPAPVVTGISPNEATPGTKITIRGENFGLISSDILGINILGKFQIWFDLCSFKENEGVLAEILTYDNHRRTYRKCQFISWSRGQVSNNFPISKVLGSGQTMIECIPHSATENALASSLWTYSWCWSYYFFSYLIRIRCLLNFLTEQQIFFNLKVYQFIP